MNDQHTPPAACWLGVPGLPTPGATPTFAVPTSWLPSVASNPKIGTRLFVSLRMVQYHSDKVFTKLDIASRTQLSAPCPATTIGRSQVDAGEQSRCAAADPGSRLAAAQHLVDQVLRDRAVCCRRTPRRIAPGRASEPRSAWTVTSASTPCRPSASGELKSWRSPVPERGVNACEFAIPTFRPKRPHRPAHLVHRRVNRWNQATTSHLVGGKPGSVAKPQGPGNVIVISSGRRL